MNIAKAIQGLLGCFIALSLAAPVWASYNPPRQASAPSGNTTTTGRRSGCLSTEASLTAIAPASHVGQTISTHPTFTWFVPDEQSFAIEFYLYQQQAAGEQLVYRSNLSSTSGLMSLTLPATVALEVGQRYRWQVVLLCNPNSPSSALVADAEIEIARPSAELETALAGAIDPAVRANLLAESGFWYDAIATANSDSRIDLLTDLAEIEAADGSSDRGTELILVITNSRLE